MAVVPITAAKGQSANPQSDTDMAIAAALLHREGAFDVAMDTSQMRRSTNVIDKTGDSSGREQAAKEDEEEQQRQAEIIQAAEQQSKEARRNRPLIGPAVATHGIRPSNLGLGK